MNLVKWSKEKVFDGKELIKQLKDDLNELFDKAISKKRWGKDVFDFEWNPSVDMVDSGDFLEVRVDMPGMKKQDIKITLENNTLWISGERKSEYKKGKHYSECFYGSFSRAISLPCKVNDGDIKAKYKRGVLRISLPKVETSSNKIDVEIK